MVHKSSADYGPRPKETHVRDPPILLLRGQPLEGDCHGNRDISQASPYRERLRARQKDNFKEFQPANHETAHDVLGGDKGEFETDGDEWLPGHQ